MTSSLSKDFHVARIGLAVGAGALFLSTAYMNVSSWIAQADTLPQALANGGLAASFELMALCGLSWAGYQYVRKRKAAAIIAGVIAATAIVFNVYATQNFLHLQTDVLVNGIEMSGQQTAIAETQINALNAQVESIITQNGGTIPRPVEAIEAQYAHLNPETNPINMGRRDTEIALRAEYERLQEAIITQQTSSAGDAVAANDTPRSVIPAGMMLYFVYAIEGIKGTLFFALGTSSGQSKQDRAKWAAIRSKQKKASRGDRAFQTTYGKTL